MLHRTAMYWAICLAIITAIMLSCVTMKHFGKVGGSTTINAGNLEIHTFSSYDELREYIMESLELSKLMPKLGYKLLTPAFEEVWPLPIPVPTPAPTPIPALSIPGFTRGTIAIPETSIAKTAKTAYGIPYSKTNVQVEGVDEADIVKTDGKYLYVASGNKVYILKAYPPQNASIITSVNTGEVLGIFIANNRLIVISSIKPQVRPLPKPEPPILPIRPEIVPPIPVFEEELTITLYSLENIEKPTVLQKINVTGHYVSSRLVGKYCYIIVNFPVYIFEDRIPLPLINNEAIAPSDIKYFGRDFSYTFTIILALNTETGDYSVEVFLTGVSNYIYMTHKNLYVLAARRPDIYVILDKIINVIVEEMPEEVKEAIEKIRSENISKIEKYKQILALLESEFNYLPSESRKKIFTGIAKEYSKLWHEETVIYRFAINGLEIKAMAKGEVPGRVLDQFSMDEHGNYFRIATTATVYSTEDSLPAVPVQVNNVYVLDMNLTIIGSLEGLAKGERIYSARYMGDLMFLVTFRRIDPLFAIDLSDPSNPRVLGRLKIPGYSEYLHPLLDKYLIGIGMDVDEKTGFMKGLKISLFDISNVTEPKEVSTVVFEKCMYSPVLHDHKAFMINYEKLYFAIPVSGNKYSGENGVYIIDALLPELNETTKAKLAVRGLIWHPGAQRALYIGDYIYTVSYDAVKIVDESLNVVNEIVLRQSSK